LYGKVLRSTTKVKAHDEANTAGIGDRVLLMETRPLSATKRWRLVQILEKAK
jgi:small subunit ribosomal protein S17